MRKLVLGAVFALFASAALANPPVQVCDAIGNRCLKPNLDGSLSVGGAFGGQTYALIVNANAATTGQTVAGVYKDSYFYACSAATWNGSSAQLQYLGPDGATWTNFTGAALTANGVIGVGIGANSSVRTLVTGTPTGLFCNLT